MGDVKELISSSSDDDLSENDDNVSNSHPISSIKGEEIHEPIDLPPIEDSLADSPLTEYAGVFVVTTALGGVCFSSLYFLPEEWMGKKPKKKEKSKK